MKLSAKKDIVIISIVSFVSAALYIALEGKIMEYGRDLSNPLFLRFLPVLLIQMGMSCLGILIVLVKNKEQLSNYGFRMKNTVFSIVGCLAVSIPTVYFLWITNNINGFLPFQGMFLTIEILELAFPLNVLGYLVIALIWGFGEGLFYVVLADKINSIIKPIKIWNLGAIICAIIAIAIHGMIGFDSETLFETLATFILMYGSLVVREKSDNAWGNILIFFVIWNAL